MVRCLVLVFVASTIAIEPATLILACIEDVWTAINLDLNKMCLDGGWMGNVVADNPICGGSSGGTTARPNSQAMLTEEDAGISVAYCAAYTSNWLSWKDADPVAHNMCNGCFLGVQGCNDGGAPPAYALAPLGDGQARGQSGTAGSEISKEDARISATYCAEEVEKQNGCSTQFVGVDKVTGHCWCAKEGGDCTSNGDVQNLKGNGHFFESKLETCLLVHLLICLFAHSLVARNGYWRDGS